MVEPGQTEEAPINSFAKITVTGKSGIAKRVELSRAAADEKWFSSVWSGNHTIEISIVDEDALHEKDKKSGMQNQKMSISLLKNFLIQFILI